MKAIITAAMVISMCLSTVNSHAADKQNETQKIEYRYAYDEQGRLANKEMLSWDEATQQWQKSSRLTYKYYKNGYNVEVSEWNANKQTYDIPSQVTLYRSQAPNLTSVKIYKMNETRDNMYLTSSTVMMEPLNANLLASK
jgi:YD repeat-containing protein